MLYNVYPLDRILAVKTTNIKPLKKPLVIRCICSDRVFFGGRRGLVFFSVL